jgi:hypothetical protein
VSWYDRVLPLRRLTPAASAFGLASETVAPASAQATFKQLQALKAVSRPALAAPADQVLSTERDHRSLRLEGVWGTTAYSCMMPPGASARCLIFD